MGDSGLADEVGTFSSHADDLHIGEISPVVHVEYLKVEHLYRILIPLVHVLLSFCVRIGAFDRFSCFCACVGFSSSVHTF